MRRLDNYLGLTVAIMTLLASAGLISLFVIFTFLDQMSDIGQDYNLIAVIKYVSYSIPRMFYETVPYAALIGSLTGLGILASNSELIIMRSAGISTWQIAIATLKPALAFIIAGLLVGELILPDFERTARARTYRGRRGQHPSQGGRSHPGVVRTTNAKIRAVAGCLRGLGPSTRVSCAYESVHGPRSRDADGRDSYGRLSSTDMDLYQPRGSAGRTHERIDVLHGPSRHLRIGRVVAGERRRLFRPRSTHSPSDARNRSQANTWGNAVRHHCANLGIRRSPSPHRIEFGTSGGLLRSQSARRHDRGNAGLVPIPQLVVVLALLGTVLLASWLPARRPSRIDPLQALRTD